MVSPEFVTWAGHSTVLIEAGGERLLTDPLLRDRVAHIRRRVPPPEPSLSRGLDAVLVSHAHRDHLDLPSLKSLEVDGPVLVPRGSGRVVQGALSGTDVHELTAGDRFSVGGVNVLATEADHDGRRIPLGRPVAALGFVVEATERIYFAGDTDVFAGMDELAHIDVALLPVWGWGKTVPAGHLDPPRAARAAALIGPDVAVPIHWGTYASPGAWLPDPSWPARKFERLAAQEAPGVEVRVLEPGEGLTLTKKGGQAPLRPDPRPGSLGA
jgi:L-ascorbate metabolism protein UlaG (beta-lactamase superfamily)